MSTLKVKNVLGANVTSYIRQATLQARLEVIFKMPIIVELRNDRFVFYAPREVTEDELEDIREDYRVI